MVVVKDKKIFRSLGLVIARTIYENIGDGETYSLENYYNKKNYYLTGRYLMKTENKNDIIIDKTVTIWPFEDLKYFNSTALEEMTSCYCIVPIKGRTIHHESVPVKANVPFYTDVGKLYIPSVQSKMNDIVKPSHSILICVEKPSSIVPDTDGTITIFRSVKQINI